MVLLNPGKSGLLMSHYSAHPDRRVSSAVVQRYLPQILDAALRQNIMIQNAAVDILGFTIKQGLAHPIQVGLDYLTLVAGC